MSVKEVIGEANKMRRKILRATRSPMNASQWHCDLECGHSMWVGYPGRKAPKSVYCNQCAAKPSRTTEGD